MPHTVCAKKVVLAIPRKPLLEISWHPVQTAPKLGRYVNSVQDVPAIRIYFVYNESWWGDQEPPSKHIITDLPIRQTKYMGSQSTRSRGGRAHSSSHSRHRRHAQRYLFLVASPDHQDTEYFVDLIERYQASKYKNCSAAKDMIRDITMQLAKVYGVDEQKIPPPETVLVKNWGASHAGAAWHVWKRNINWSSVGARILKPHRNDNIFIVGSAFCGGQCQLWMEGALQTVEKLLNTYLYTSWCDTYRCV